MINVLIPAVGSSLFFESSFFPKPMIEIAGRTMLEKVVENYKSLPDKQFIFCFSRKDCTEFHLDEAAMILTDNKAKILILEEETTGALCTCLMAIDIIGTEDSLLIANADQIIDTDYKEVLRKFQAEDASAGVITFENIHPRWSYAKIKEDSVIETAEKRPISKHAIAGFYYYKHGRDFVEAAERVLLKGNDLGGKYYISSSLNEIVLAGKSVAYYEVDRTAYHSFYSQEKIKEYEDYLGGVYENC